MSQSDASWIPRFEYQDDHWVVYFGGREWWLMSAQSRQLDTSSHWDRQPWVQLTLDMKLQPPKPDLSIPDNIILGDN